MDGTRRQSITARSAMLHADMERREPRTGMPPYESFWVDCEMAQYRTINFIINHLTESPREPACTILISSDKTGPIRL